MQRITLNAYRFDDVWVDGFRGPRDEGSSGCSVRVSARKTADVLEETSAICLAAVADVVSNVRKRRCNAVAGVCISSVPVDEFV